MSAPLVTIITITYNSAEYIKDAIESVLAVNYPCIQYIIADDASSDKTWDLIQSYNDNRIFAYRHPINIGEYNNRQWCIEHAEGEYVMFVDGDDIILPHALKLMIPMLEHFNECALAIIGYAHPNFIYPFILSPEELFKFHFFGRSFLSNHMVGNLFRRKVFEEVNFKSVNVRCGDYYLRLNLALKYPAIIVGGGTVWARMTPGQASSKLNNISGFMESYDLDLGLFSKQLPLNEEDTLKAQQSLRKKLHETYFQFMKKMQFKNCAVLHYKYGLTLTELLRHLFNRSKDQLYISNASPVQPLKMPFDQNPLSNKFNYL